MYMIQVKWCDSNWKGVWLGVREGWRRKIFFSKLESQRQTLMTKISDPLLFFNLNHNEKLNFLVNDPSMVKHTAKFIVEAYEYRSTLI